MDTVNHSLQVEELTAEIVSATAAMFDAPNDITRQTQYRLISKLSKLTNESTEWLILKFNNEEIQRRYNA